MFVFIGGKAIRLRNRTARTCSGENSKLSDHDRL
jgi:hypothetical protein